MIWRSSLSVTLLTSIVISSGCWRLPENFSSLPLKEKVAIYENRLKHGGARDYDAEELIAAHGYSAAESMVPYIAGKGGISPFIAVNIAWDVQSRGCDLRGSAAAEAMQSLLVRGHSQPDERIA